MDWSDALPLVERMRHEIRNGTFVKYGVATSAAAAGLSDRPMTLRAVADKYHEHVSLDPKRRKHRLPILKQALDVICRTTVDGAAFGEKGIEAIRTLDLERFRDSRRMVFRREDARLAERRKKIAANEPEAHAIPVPRELAHGQHGEIGIARSCSCCAG
jgi:hypothetical protein